MRKAILYILAVVVLILDQITKWWVRHHFMQDESRDIIPGLFALTFVRNTGGAFGILPHSTGALAVAAIIAVVVIVVIALRTSGGLPLSLAWALGLPLGGALGNMIDRVRLSYVVDFLDVHVADHHWPVFNVADTAICTGVALLALRYWSSPAQSKESSLALEEKS